MLRLDKCDLFSGKEPEAPGTPESGNSSSDQDIDEANYSYEESVEESQEEESSEKEPDPENDQDKKYVGPGKIPVSDTETTDDVEKAEGYRLARNKIKTEYFSPWSRWRF